MSITQRPFGVTPAGEQVTEYTMTNREGACVSALDFGGIITRILVKDRNGRLDDVNLSFEDIGVYARGLSGSMGMLIGRVGNRIRGAAFELEGQRYTLPGNDNGNCLHGGVGFGLRMWKVQPAAEGDALELTLRSEDGDQGFPGTLELVPHQFRADHQADAAFQNADEAFVPLGVQNLFIHQGKSVRAQGHPRNQPAQNGGQPELSHQLSRYKGDSYGGAEPQYEQQHGSFTGFLASCLGRYRRA